MLDTNGLCPERSEMFQIIKFCGITSAQLAALDTFLASEENHTPTLRYGEWRGSWESYRDGKYCRPCAKQLKVRNETHGRYMVEIRVEIMWRHRYLEETIEFWIPRRIMEGIYEALGIYPTSWNKFSVPFSGDAEVGTTTA